MNFPIRIIVLTLFLTTLNATAEEKPLKNLSAIPFTNVRINDDFWAPRLRVNHEVSIPHNFEWCEKTGRISNFAKTAGLMEGEFEGIYFNDSDVYKVLEGASYALANNPDPVLEKMVDDVIEKIAAAQGEDGYLNVYYTIVKPDERWTNLKSMHELYCAGHLIEAAVAHFNATGKRTLLDVAIKFVDLIDSIFGPDKRHGVPGHEEIELALIKLYHLTGEERYLKLAEFFIEERGRATDRELFGKQLQDHLPIREQDEVFGHAVRAMYLYSGVADLTALTNDQGYRLAMDRIWEDLVSHKMYITGGIGVSGHGEGFSGGYDLPNEQAYAETCASIALAFFNHRMNLLYADRRYADVLEQALYNGLLSGVSLDGDKFFYRNPLASSGPETFQTSGGKEGDSKQHRQHWFRCACCPTNVVRFLPKLGEYVYAKNEEGIYAVLYMTNEAMVSIKDVSVKLTQKTNYPWDGDVKIIVNPEKPVSFDFNLRIPGWCENARIRVNGRKLKTEMRNGYACITRKWKRGDTITLRIPMPIQRIEAHPLVKEDRGRIALRRGPLVYCLEQIDNEAGVKFIALPRGAELTSKHKSDLLGGITVIEGTGFIKPLEGWKNELYRPAREPEEAQFTAIPYYAWDNREPGEMVVWLPEDPALAPLMTIAALSQCSTSYLPSGGGIAALNDQIEPRASNDKSIPRFTWWNHKGTQEWAQYNFKNPETVSTVDVYWYDDRDTGECRIPESWRLLYKAGEEWKPVTGASEYGTELNRANQVNFDPVKTSALRLEVQLQSEYSGGILEWTVW